MATWRHDRTLARLRKQLGAKIVDSFFEGAAAMAGRLPAARPERHGVEVVRDVAYVDSGRREHRLDVYRPIERNGPMPVVLYVHGGGFRILSKESHWVMGLAFARRGYALFNISYRLSGTHPYPAAVEDACAAYSWVARNAAHWGGDAGRLVVAGESAGANLVTGLTIAACYERREPWAREVFETGVVPKVALPACGMLQVSDPERVGRGRSLSRVVMDRLLEVGESYLDGVDVSVPGALDFADPLVVLERGEAPARPLPAFFASVGTRDPVLHDTRRLYAALRRLGAPVEARYYEGGFHAFHAFVFLRAARRCWRDTFAFLDRHLGRAPQETA